MKRAKSKGENLTSELSELVAGVVAETEGTIHNAIGLGWKPPAHWKEKLAGARCGVNEDPDVWFATLYEQFCNEVRFPKAWTVLEKVTVFGELLHQRNRGVLHPITNEM